MTELYPGMTSLRLGEKNIEPVVHRAGQLRGDLPPLVLLHGEDGDTHRHFETLFPMLADRNLVVSIDLAVPAKSRLELTDLTRQVQFCIENIPELENFDLLGYSLGGCVALKLASAFKGVRSLTLLNTWALSDPSIRLWSQLWLAHYNSKDYGALGAFSLVSTRSRRNLTGIDCQVIEDLISTYSPTAGAPHEVDLCSRIDLREAASKIDIPTLIIGSLQDVRVPIGHSYELFGLIREARLAEINTGHASLIERPAEILAHITDFHLDPNRLPAGATYPDEYLSQLRSNVF